jgi:hypothetical protein
MPITKISNMYISVINILIFDKNNKNKLLNIGLNDEKCS